jgi:pyrimidine-nucleoside phosphorylase
MAEEDRGVSCRAGGSKVSLFVRTIIKKRDGQELGEGEIADFVGGVTSGAITDEQAAAFLMAVCIRGMTTRETAALTFAMMRSGETWDLSRHGFVADKHSTGGVGDKATLVLAPLLAAVGVKAGMMSGRGLGHTGGTLDKLESIPGFKTGLPKADFDRLLDTVGCALIGQTDSIAPADRRLYALRDVTGTVESIPLITASILSKKLATGAHAVVFDVKTGNGAFMADPKDAEKLGRALVDTTRATGRKASGYLTAMDRPIGEAVGNANEVEESIRMLAGEGPADLRENTLLLGVDLLLAAGVETNPKDARRRLNAALADGRALEVFAKLIAAQGGDATVCDDASRLPQPKSRRDVPAAEGGVVTRIATREVGMLAIELGCGRAKREDVIDPASGFRVKKKPGDAVAAGEPLLVVELGPTAKPRADFFERLAACWTIAPAGAPVESMPFVVGTL